jgi:aconitate hydratase
MDPAEYDQLDSGDILVLKKLREKLPQGQVLIENRTRERTFYARHDLSPRQLEVVLQGGLINWVKHLAAMEHASFSPARKL